MLKQFWNRFTCANEKSHRLTNANTQERHRQRPRRALYVGIFMVMVLLAPAKEFTPAYAAEPGRDATIPTNGTTLYIPLTYNYYHTSRAQTAFGTQMYGYSGFNLPEYGALNESGATWIRNELAWRSVEPENTAPADYNWNTVARVVAAATDGNFNILLTLNFAPDWAAESTNGPIYADNLDDFAEYVGAVVERLDGDGIDDLPGSPVVTHFQFYNEPDRSPAPDDRGGWGYAPEAYADMLKAVAPAVRAANPNAKIVFGGLAHDWFEEQGGPYVRSFLDNVLTQDVGDSFDVFAFHVYPPFAANWTTRGPGLYEKTLHIRDILTDHGLDKPMMISEAGMHSNDDPGYPMTEELQARYVPELYAEAIAAGVQTLFWFSFVDPPSWYPYQNGLVTDEDPPRRKPAYRTYQRTAQILSGTHGDGVLSTAETGDPAMQVYRLRDDAESRTVYVAWMTPIDGNGAAALVLPGAAATVTTIHGQTSTVNDANDGVRDGSFTVNVTAQPVFIEVNTP